MTVAYLRAIRGPVLLITIGILMLADQQTSLGIGTTWPVLLVVAGLMVLAERASVKENPWAAPGAGGGSFYTTTPPPPPTAAPSAFRRFGETGPEPGNAPTPADNEGGPQA